MFYFLTLRLSESICGIAKIRARISQRLTKPQTKEIVTQIVVSCKVFPVLLRRTQFGGYPESSTREAGLGDGHQTVRERGRYKVGEIALDLDTPVHIGLTKIYQQVA